jgi:hypothetical protein
MMGRNFENCGTGYGMMGGAYGNEGMMGNSSGSVPDTGKGRNPWMADWMGTFIPSR